MRHLLIATAAMLLCAGTAHAHGVKRSDLQHVDGNPNTCDWVQRTSRLTYVDCTGKAFTNWYGAFLVRKPLQTVNIYPDNCAGENPCSRKVRGYDVQELDMVSPIIVTPSN